MLELNAGHSFSAEFFRENALVTILGIDSKGMVLKAGRIATYLSKFLSSLYLTFSRFTPRAGDKLSPGAGGSRVGKMNLRSRRFQPFL